MTSLDNVVLRGVRLESKKHTKSRRLVVFMHGNSTYAPHKAAFFKELSRNIDADAVCFNYRGFGLSDGQALDERSIELDTHAIATYVKRIAKPDQEIILWGKSFGVAASIYCAMNNPDLFKYIVLDSGFTSILDMIKTARGDTFKCKLGYLFALVCPI